MDSVRFWYYDWVGVGPVYILLTRVFRVVSNEDSSVKECYIWDGEHLSWDVSVGRVLRQSDSIEFESLLSILANVFLFTAEADFRIWKPDSSVAYSVLSIRSRILLLGFGLLVLQFGWVLLLLEWRLFVGWWWRARS